MAFLTVAYFVGLHLFDCLWTGYPYKLFSTKDVKNEDFDKCLECAAPKCWSKYTTGRSVPSGKSLVTNYQKHVDEKNKKAIKDILIQYDSTLLVADPRLYESNKFLGLGAYTRY